MRWYALFVFAARLCAQTQALEAHFQATTITQTHGPFNAPYSGENSLRPIRETDTSLTATLFLTFRYRNTEIGFHPELAGGTGFSGVLGIAGFTNGEIPRVGNPRPTPYIGRLYLKQKVSRFSWTLGKIAASDFFDQNSFSHDPRTQFQNWSLMYNGAWDYPADTRGYTIGAVQEMALGRSTLRIGSFMEPVEANALKLDRHIAANHSEAFEWQQSYSEKGAVRVLVFLNHANMGVYRDAMDDITAARRSGTLKYGFGLNVEQRLTSTIGVFGRLGWNDGKSESWTFTEIDRTASGGVSIAGTRWKRPKDVIGIGAAVNALSGDHRAYFARGGYGFIIGDGRLDHPGREGVLELYYSCRLTSWFSVSPDYQFILHPAYNRDRGPVHVAGVRFHVDR